jgi:hypothetical protein
MIKYNSLRNLFSLQLPAGWQTNVENNVHTFYNEDEIQGVFQISAYFNSTGVPYDSDSELEKERKAHPTAQLIDVSKFQAVHYGVLLDNRAQKCQTFLHSHYQ